MTLKEKECLMTLTNAVLEIKTMEDVSVQLPVATSDERKQICEFLERGGYAYIKNKYGRDYIVCDVQEKTLSFALEELEEKEQQKSERRE